jgi:hypothetical protein
MNFLSFPRIGLKHLKFLSLFLLTPLFLSLTLFSQTATAQQSQLSLVDIITVLRSKKVTPAEKNQLLTEGVKQRGVTFALNTDLEKELRIAGADETLIAVIRVIASGDDIRIYRRRFHAARFLRDFDADRCADAGCAGFKHFSRVFDSLHAARSFNA